MTALGSRPTYCDISIDPHRLLALCSAYFLDPLVIWLLISPLGENERRLDRSLALDSIAMPLSPPYRLDDD